MPEEEKSLVDIIVSLLERVRTLESQVYTLMTDQPKDGEILSPGQLDELTSLVGQNLTRILRKHMERQ